MRLRLFGLLLLAVSLSISLSARADSLMITAASFNGIGSYQFQAFDNSLGTLNSVSVEIDGTLQATFPTQVTIEDVKGVAVPIMLPYVTEIDQSFTGALGGFSTASPGVYISTGQTTGWGDPVLVATYFDYRFTFNNISQLTGSTPPSSFSGPTAPPIEFTGNLSSFENVPGGQIIGIPTLALGGDDTLAAYQLTETGAIIVTYDYTPTSPDTTSPVPEPSSIMLLATGVLAIFNPVRRRLTVR